MNKTIERGRPPLQDRKTIKEIRFQFAWSAYDVERFGNRKTMIAAIKDFVANFNIKPDKKSKK